MAAAIVSGAASLILSKNFRLKPQHVRKILEGSATPLFVYGGGSGEINFARALILTPSIQEPFIAIDRQLLRGFPKGYRQRGRKIIGLSSQLLKELDEDSFYDMRIALLIDFHQKKWLRDKGKL